ncbi:uncharacterized protein [Mobula birostris]|uniref:uncharacterized protein n=1 Tax=Mobula birostris TaxID=1983395 RepID=UPI003B2872E4
MGITTWHHLDHRALRNSDVTLSKATDFTHLVNALSTGLTGGEEVTEMRKSYLAFLGVCLCSIWDQESSAHPPAGADQNLCLTESCGPNTECHNVLGSFYCTCKAGFYSDSGDRRFADSTESTCKDYNECYTVKTSCGTDATCYNTMGGFYCLCHAGFARASGERKFTGYSAGCEDINECLQQPCGPQEVCHNTKGSFFCSHTTRHVTSRLKTTLSPFLNCLTNLLKNQSIIDNCFAKEQQQQFTAHEFCSLINSTLTFAKRMCEQTNQAYKTQTSPVTLKDVTSFGNKFIADDSGVEPTSVFLDAMESFALVAALTSPSEDLRPIITAHLGLDVRIVQVSDQRSQSKAPERITLLAKGNVLDVYATSVVGDKKAGAAIIVFLSYKELKSLQSGEFIKEGRSRPFQMRSGVVSAVIGNQRNQHFTESVNITLRHTEDPVMDGWIFCVYWNHSGHASHWSPEGCKVFQSNDTHTTCGCHHFSSFAILVSTSQVWEDNDKSLSWITLVGLTTSLMCLALAISTFLFCVQTKNFNITIHINLCVSMFLGELLFLLGIERTNSKVVCALVAGCLHYLFLVACAWMCVEGIHLHLIVRNLQKISNAGVHKVLRCFMYPFAYGVPAVIVIVSAATYPAGYGSSLYCWLSVKKGLIWSFIGPICAIILFNMILFMVTMQKLRTQITHLNTEVTKIKDTRKLIFKAIAQGFVLGCTWILSLFHFHGTTTILTYLFTIIHSFQGTLIFLILCLLNQQVRDGYRSCWNRMCRNWKRSSLTDSASTSMPMTTVSPVLQQSRTMEWRCSSPEWVLCLGYILSLLVVSSQPCQPGFKLEADLGCTDINECTEVAQLCGPNTRCHNILGSYFCTCMQGFQPYINASHGTSCQEVARHTRLRKRAALVGQEFKAPDHGNNMPSEHRTTTAPDHESIPDNRNALEPGSGHLPEPGNGNTFNLIMQSTSESDNRNINGPENENATERGNLRTAEPGYGSAAEPGNKSSSDPYNQNTSQPSKGSMPRTESGYTPEPGNRSTPEAGNGSKREATTELDPGPSSTLSTDVRNHSDPARQWDPRLTTTLEQPSSPGRLFCSMITNVSRLFNKPCYNPIKGSPLKDVVQYVTQLLMEDFPLAGMRQDERINSASSILMAVERMAITLELTSALDQVMAMPSQEMELQVIHVDSSPSADGIQLQAKDNALGVSWTTANNTFGKGSAVFAFIVYNNLDPVLQGACYRDEESGDFQDNVQLHSKVVSAALEFSPRTSFSVVVKFVLKRKEVGTTAGRLSCVYWHHTPTRSYWSTSGCELVQSNFSHTTCQCNHLSSFAILMSFNEQLQGYSQDCLSVITFIGIPISLVCLLTALATFTFCSQARNAVSTTHTHLCLSLFLAELLFLVGINRTVNRAMCGIVAGCLHYLFLVAFTWMSLESTQLYLMVRNLRKMRVSNSSQLGKVIYPLGYGSPALVVAISAVIYPNGYGSERNCWLQVKNGFAWSFLGPVYFIILANTFLFTMTLYTLNEELSNRDTKVSKIKDTRMLIFKAISQVFILGCTWILGLFHFQEETVVMAYLFTIVNSFQGTFIFIILCLLNPKIRAEYQKWIFSICKTRRVLFNSESTKTTLSVTSNHLQMGPMTMASRLEVVNFTMHLSRCLSLKVYSINISTLKAEVNFLLTTLEGDSLIPMDYLE